MELLHMLTVVCACQRRKSLADAWLKYLTCYLCVCVCVDWWISPDSPRRLLRTKTCFSSLKGRAYSLHQVTFHLSSLSTFPFLHHSVTPDSSCDVTFSRHAGFSSTKLILLRVQ